jgi:8-oxo-dGTP pyrophosphatase MutT (NUDIX family)
MANSKLQGKTYLVPDNVLTHIKSSLVKYPSAEGVKRAKNIIHEPNISYEAMKRIKNFFDTFNSRTTDRTQYELAGGNPMKEFIEATLNQQRAGVQRSKEVRRDMTANPNSELHPYQPPKINEEKEEKKEKSKNAVAVIVNKNNKILLLKRVDDPKIWQPNKWALAGGGIDKGETPQQAVEREILEETGLEIKKFVNSFSIERHGDSIEHMFACRYEGEDTDVELDTKENTNYGWYDVSEMEYLDTVPHLIEYITLVFKNYDD